MSQPATSLPPAAPPCLRRKIRQRTGDQRLSRALLLGIAALSVAALGLAVTTSAQDAVIPTSQPAAVSDVAATQPDDALPRTDATSIATWFAQLADADPMVREQASNFLLHLQQRDLPALRKTVQQSLPLAPSQAFVLRQIVTQAYLSGEKYQIGDSSGFLGISLGQHPGGSLVSFPGTDESPESMRIPGVVIEGRFAGFCAAGALHDGDVIVGIVERPLVMMRTSEDLVDAVSHIPPGKTLHLLILHNGRVMNVPLSLDARPLLAELPALNFPSMLNLRQIKADRFWEQSFAQFVNDSDDQVISTRTPAPDPDRGRR